MKNTPINILLYSNQIQYHQNYKNEGSMLNSCKLYGVVTPIVVILSKCPIDVPTRAHLNIEYSL